MHAWAVIAFLLFAVAAGLALYQRAFTFALVAAGLAATLTPAVFELSS